jgi:hypothetical protein
MMFGPRDIEVGMFSPADIEMRGADWYRVEFNTLRAVPITPPSAMMFGLLDIEMSIAMFGSRNIRMSIVMFATFDIEMGGAN